jgi:hypothetical protein
VKRQIKKVVPVQFADAQPRSVRKASVCWTFFTKTDVQIVGHLLIQSAFIESCSNVYLCRITYLFCYYYKRIESMNHLQLFAGFNIVEIFEIGFCEHFMTDASGAA